VELQEPGPVYLLASAGGFAARAGLKQARTNAPSQTAVHRTVQRLDSGPIVILALGWNPPYSREPWSQPRQNFYTARKNRSQSIENNQFPDTDIKSH